MKKYRSLKMSFFSDGDVDVSVQDIGFKTDDSGREISHVLRRQSYNDVSTSTISRLSRLCFLGRFNG